MGALTDLPRGLGWCSPVGGHPLPCAASPHCKMKFLWAPSGVEPLIVVSWPLGPLCGEQSGGVQAGLAGHPSSPQDHPSHLSTDVRVCWSHRPCWAEERYVRVGCRGCRPLDLSSLGSGQVPALSWPAPSSGWSQSCSDLCGQGAQAQWAMWRFGFQMLRRATKSPRPPQPQPRLKPDARLDPAQPCPQLPHHLPVALPATCCLLAVLAVLWPLAASSVQTRSLHSHPWSQALHPADLTGLFLLAPPHGLPARAWPPAHHQPLGELQ